MTDEAELPRWMRWLSKCLQLLPPELPGKARVARLLFKFFREQGPGTIDTRSRETYFVPSLWEPVAFHLLIDGVYEPTLLHLLKQYLKPGSTFVDVGANVGAFSVPAAKLVGPTGRVVAVEASPHVFPYLAHNVRANRVDDIVHPVQAAAYACDDGLLPFYEPPADHFGMGALAPQFNVTPVYVPARKLDTILSEAGCEHVDVLKVDVEGFEADVFRGATALLEQNPPPLIVFEFCDWAESRVPGGTVGEAQEVLLGYGYMIWRLGAFIGKRSPLRKVAVNGFEMLVARKG